MNVKEDDEFAHVDALKQRLKTGFLHINYRLIEQLFMEKRNNR